MNRKQEIIKAITGQRVLPLFYHENRDVCLEVIRALYEAGIRVIEFTNRGENALETFRHLVNVCSREFPDLMLGIGTIKNKSQAREYKKAGAPFLVSPGYVEELSRYSSEKDILFIPGCMTVQEIIAAENAGIDFVKLFPANLLGTSFLKNIRPLFPGMSFMATGGISNSRESIAPWLSAGAAAVGLGSSLITEELLAKGDYAGITASAKLVLESLATGVT